MKHFKTAESRAVAYAAFKELDRMLKEDGEIEPGFRYDCSGETLQITIPSGTVLSRGLGQDGKGHVYKKAAQNLNGYAVLLQLFTLLKRFKQAKRAERILMTLVSRALKSDISSEAAFLALHPDKKEELKQFKEDLKLPKREEDTSREVLRKDKDVFPTLTFFGRKAEAA